MSGKSELVIGRLLKFALKSGRQDSDWIGRNIPELALPPVPCDSLAGGNF